uniref:Uncharacterized protein n=1 Tax=Photinus pyralis TaxID=7054 RepID=A0A1Y1NCH7_PHOPY
MVIYSVCGSYFIIAIPINMSVNSRKALNSLIGVTQCASCVRSERRAINRSIRRISKKEIKPRANQRLQVIFALRQRRFSQHFQGRRQESSMTEHQRGFYNRCVQRAVHIEETVSANRSVQSSRGTNDLHFD